MNSWSIMNSTLLFSSSPLRKLITPLPIIIPFRLIAFPDPAPLL